MKVRKQTPYKPKRSTKKSKVVKASPGRSEDDGNNYISVLKKTAVIYLGSIPHGFYEEQMKQYFSQFGKVLRTRVARSSKTGRSKGFGYIEFADAEVAKIVADTMNNYLMGNRILKAKVLSDDKNHGLLFAGRNWSEEHYPKLKNRESQIRAKNKRVKSEKEAVYEQRKLDRLRKSKERIEELGYEWEPVMDVKPSYKNSPTKVVEVGSENSSELTNSNVEESSDTAEENDSSGKENDSEVEMESADDSDSVEEEEANESTSDDENEQSESDDKTDNDDDGHSPDTENSEDDSEVEEKTRRVQKPLKKSLLEGQKKLKKRKSENCIVKRKNTLAQKRGHILRVQNNKKLKLAAKELMMQGTSSDLPKKRNFVKKQK